MRGLIALVAFAFVLIINPLPAVSDIFSHPVGPDTRAITAPLLNGPTSGTKIPDNRIDQALATLSVHDRAVMHRVLLALPQNTRENVIYFDVTGKAYATKRELLTGADRYVPRSSGSRVFVNSGGQEILGPINETIPAAQYRCNAIPVFPGTGAYREIVSTCGIPYDYSAVSADCNYLVSNNDPITGLVNTSGGESDTGYAYLGGFSSNGNAVDAGFQYSQNNQDWTLFISVNNAFYTAGYSTRLRCNQIAQLQFYPASTQFLAATEWGYNSQGQWQNVTIVGGVVPANGWSATNCTACVVKRVTSIAQSYARTLHDNFTDGSFFGYDLNNGQPEIGWEYAQVGSYYSAGPHFLVRPWGNKDTGNYITYPYDPSRWHITYYNPTSEIDGVYLHR